MQHSTGRSTIVPSDPLDATGRSVGHQAVPHSRNGSTPSRARKAGMLRVAALAAMLLGLAGCTTERLTEPGQTATEQLLISVAVDHAVGQLNPTIPAGTKVFVDAQYFDNAPGDAATYSKYAVASIRDRLLKLGARLVDDRKSADMVAELRTGGQSINHTDFLVGLPAVPIPIPLSGTVTTPKVPFFEKDQQTGLAKLAITAYDKDGALTASTGPAYGRSELKHWTVLLFISWTDEDLLPDTIAK